MSYRYVRTSRSASHSGVALIITLGFIVLITILIVSLIAFSRLSRMSTASYSRSVQAQEIAQGGIQDILGDLHQEIIAGSTAYTQNGTTVYVPTTNRTAEPARFGYAANLYTNDVSSTLLPPTLIRVSRSSQDGNTNDFYPSLPSYYTSGLLTNHASAANSSTLSSDGRSIPATRWNKIDLLTTNTTIPPPFATNTPDWVYVTRGGSRACVPGDLTGTPNILPSPSLTNSSPVIGRYAYAIYDEGALIDVNCAGYISAATNNYTALTNYAPANSYTMPHSGVTQVLTGKTYSSYADLTQLTGLSSQATIDNLIKWRNASANLAATGAGTNFFLMTANNATNGFLVFQSSATGTDSPLLARQDLINYMAAIDPSRTSAAMATPYLGTFSRAANAPSWNPTLNAANMPNYYGMSSPMATFISTYDDGSTAFSPTAYKDNAELTSVNGSPNPNRDIPNVRYTSSQTITHYNDDGTSYTYTVKPGDPVVQHRFSLAKIAWLGTSGPNGAAFNSSLSAGQQAAAIQACFGLTWDGQNFSASPPHFDRWDYVAATTSNIHIQTLDEVANGSTATANPGYREPNFFEMLKAGILSGSLGQSPGPVAQGATAEGVVAVGMDDYSREKNRHILQIGANIIDQFDTDSIPTAIHLAIFGSAPPASSLSNEADLAFNTVYGDENLPGLTKLDSLYVEDWWDATNKVGYYKLWTNPELWNIHQVPATGLDMTSPGKTGYPHPTQMRLRAYGKINYLLTQGAASIPTFGTGAVPALDYDDATTAYPYHQYQDGTSKNITGGQALSSTSTPGPAGMIYFTDFLPGSNPLQMLYSPFFRNPQVLQFSSTTGNLYLYNKNVYPTLQSGAFAGTASVNLSSYDPGSPVYYNDYLLPADTRTGTWQGYPFVSMFAGEYTLPDMTGPGDNISSNLIVTKPFYVFVECQDPTTSRWHPCGYIAQLYGNPNSSTYNSFSANNNILSDDSSLSFTVNYIGSPTVHTSANHAANGITNQGAGARGGCLVRPDPRTDRFSVSTSVVAQPPAGPAVNSTMNPNPSKTYFVEQNFPTRSWGFVYNPDAGATQSAEYIGSWASNLITTAANTAFYVDPDGVVRPGDSYRQNINSGDGCLLYHGTGGPPNVAPGAKDNTSIATTPQASTLPTSMFVGAGATAYPIGSAQARRPVILDRPFRSVGELGYAFRDLPFKSVDFFSQSSGDAALLDLFSVSDEASISAGELDLSNTPARTLTAVMSGATKMEIDAQYQTATYDSISAYPAGFSASTGAPNFMTSTEASIVASGLSNSFLTNGPLNNRSDLVTRLDPILTALAAPTSSGGSGYLDYANKAYAEAPIRALSNIGNSRTWNLLIDIIAQAGQMSPTATSLDNFMVQGERRYWLHIAIDRYTGKIIDQQLEPVYE